MDAVKPRRFAWLCRHPWRSAALAILAGVVLLNLVAYRHARAMLTFSADGDKTPPPEGLGPWGKAKALLVGVTVPRPALTQTPGDIGLSAETVRFAADDGVTLEAWRVVPPGPKGTVVLFHGYAACRSALLPEADAVVGLGYAALVVDFRGCGGSDGSACTLGYDEARDVVAALRYARAELPGPVVLFGQSMGGAAVLRAAAVHGADPDAVIVEAVFARTLTTVRNRFALMGVPSFPGAELLVFWGGVRGGFDGFSHDPAEYARGCRVPTLVLHGAADRNATPDEGRAIYENLAGRKELMIFDGVGHTSLCAADRPRWAAGVGRFVASLPGRRASARRVVRHVAERQRLDHGGASGSVRRRIDVDPEIQHDGIPDSHFLGAVGQLFFRGVRPAVPVVIGSGVAPEQDRHGPARGDDPERVARNLPRDHLVRECGERLPAGRTGRFVRQAGGQVERSGCGEFEVGGIPVGM